MDHTDHEGGNPHSHRTQPDRKVPEPDARGTESSRSANEQRLSLDALAEIYHTSPYGISKRAYLELCLTVANLLTGRKGRIKAKRLYRNLPPTARGEIDPGRGGIGITNVCSEPSTLSIKPGRPRRRNGTWRTKPTHFRMGPLLQRAHVPSPTNEEKIADEVQRREEAGDDAGRPNGHRSGGAKRGQKPGLQRSDRESEADQIGAYNPQTYDFEARGTRRERTFLDTRSRMQSERLLFLHLLKCSRASRYSADENGEGWIPVPAEQLKTQMGAPTRTALVWEGSELVEAKDDGWYHPDHGLCREFRIPDDVLDEWLNLGKGSRRWWLHTLKPKRTTEPTAMTTVLKDENDHYYPDLIDGALRVLKDADHTIDTSAIEDAEDALCRRESRDVRAQLVQLRMAKEVVEQQTTESEGDMATIKNAYEVQELSGRIGFKRGGPVGLPKAVKQRAYAHYTNYDIASCHTAALKQVADELQELGTEIDSRPLDAYAGKSAVADEHGLPVQLVKIAEHAVKYGASLPLSRAQAQVIENETGYYPEIATAAEKYASCPDEALKTLHKVFSSIRQVVIEIAEALLDEYWDANKQPGGRKGWCMKNAAGIPFRPSEWDDGHEQRSKVMAWALQGFEAAFVHSITILSQDYDYDVVANEHDGAIVDGTIPDAAIEEAREMSGFHRAAFVEKDFADADDMEKVYGPAVEDEADAADDTEGDDVRPPRPSTAARNAEIRPETRLNELSGVDPP